MLYLSGSTHKEWVADAEALGIGLMTSPSCWHRPQLRHFPHGWAADNGCFAKGDTFDPDGWLRWLDALPRENCMFAVAPDVVQDAKGTLSRAIPYLPLIRGMGFKAAFVAQNGIEDYPPPWGEFDVLFIGGDDTFKYSGACRSVVAEAKRRGLWVHMGRVNSYRRLMYSRDIGCDSADGTFLAFGPRVNLTRLKKWISALGETPALFDYKIMEKPR